MTKDIVRTGTDKAVISAVFTNVPKDCEMLLSQSGLTAEEGQLFLEREIRSDGGSIARINNRPVNISLLKQVGEMLVNIHGQHDNQILLSPDRHIDILDSYAESDAMLADYQDSFHSLQRIAKQINALKTDANQKQFRISQLYEIVSEIENLNIKDGEDEQIKAELAVSKNAVALSEAIYSANAVIAGTDDSRGVVENVSAANAFIEQYSDLMPELSALCERLESARIEVQDISQELDSILGKLNVDPKRFDWLNQRSEELRRICKKYGPTLDDVLNTLANSKQELQTLENSEQDLSKLEEQKTQILTEVSKKALALSDHRKKAAERFVKQVTDELEFLNMPNVKIVVESVQGKLTLKGMDTIEFLISANVGEQPRPLARIASGGELSRIMLALKNVIAEKDAIGTLIFDEID
ncbi:MAG: DNA repair protein RecN, partial [Ruminococcus sp.]|nr:DNA repair protein RecN [Ruminococcus sp.]